MTTSETSPVTIVVTANDIANGQPYAMESCPVALAARRRLTSAGIPIAFMSVDNDYIEFDVEEWNPSGTDFSIPTPDRVDNFIRDFDRKLPVKPIRFTVDIPKEAFRQ